MMVGEYLAKQANPSGVADARVVDAHDPHQLDSALCRMGVTRILADELKPLFGGEVALPQNRRGLTEVVIFHFLLERFRLQQQSLPNPFFQNRLSACP